MFWLFMKSLRENNVVKREVSQEIDAGGYQHGGMEKRKGDVKETEKTISQDLKTETRRKW